jgi:hypothetical protein
MYLCSGIYRRLQFLAKVKATSTGKLLDSLPMVNSDWLTAVIRSENY